MVNFHLPRWLRTFRDDGTGLAILGALSVLRGVSYFGVNPDRSPAHSLEALLPVTAWAWVWIVVGLVCLAAVADNRLRSLAVGSAVGIHAAWAFSFIGATLFGVSARGWVSALNYIGISLIFLWAVSRGQRTEVNLKFHGDRDA